MSGGNVPRIALWIISEFKLNDHLKIDGRKVDVLLLGLRNDYHLHHYPDNTLVNKGLHGMFRIKVQI